MNYSLQRECTLTYPRSEAMCVQRKRIAGVGDGNRIHLIMYFQHSTEHGRFF
jgi:hypothetical protein